MTRDMDTVKMSYEEMIDTLKGLVFGTFDRTTSKEREALDMAIEALQTEPSADVIPISRGMTNGDMIKAMFPNCVQKEHINNGYFEMYFDGNPANSSYMRVSKDWWNAPYKGNLSEKPTGSESEDKWMEEEHYSNCLIEAIKAKIRWGKEVKIIYIPSWKNEVFCPHFMWHDLSDNTIKDFHAEYGKYVEKWYNLFWFKGNIRCRPYSVYERWLKTKSWHESEDK